MQLTNHYYEVQIPTVIKVATHVLAHRLVIEGARKLVAFLINKSNNIIRIEYDGNAMDRVEYTIQKFRQFHCKEKILTSRGVLCISDNKLYHIYYDDDIVELSLPAHSIKTIVGSHHVFLVKESRFPHNSRILIYSFEHNDIESFSATANLIAYNTHPTGSTIAVSGNKELFTIFEKDNNVKIVEEKFATKYVEVGPGVILASNNKESIIVTPFKVEHMPININLYRLTSLICTPSWRFCVIGFDKNYLIGISSKNDIILRTNIKLVEDHVWFDLKNDAIIISGLGKASRITTVAENAQPDEVNKPIIRTKLDDNLVRIGLAEKQALYTIIANTIYNFLPYTLAIRGECAYILDLLKYRYSCTIKRRPKTNILAINCNNNTLTIEVENGIVRRDSGSSMTVTLPCNKYPKSNIKVIVKDNILTAFKEIPFTHYSPKISISNVTRIHISLYYNDHNLNVWHYLKIDVNYKNPYAAPISVILRLSSYTHSQTMQFKLRGSGGQIHFIIDDRNYDRAEIVFANRLLHVSFINAIATKKHIKIKVIDIKPIAFSYTGEPTKFKVTVRVHDASVLGIGLGKRVWVVDRHSNTISFEVEKDLMNTKELYLLVDLGNRVIRLTLHGLYDVILSRFAQELASIVLSELNTRRRQSCYQALSDGYVVLVDRRKVAKKWVRKGENFCVPITVKLICKDLREVKLPPLLNNDFRVVVWLENSTLVFRLTPSSSNHVMILSYANTIKFNRSTVFVRVADLLDTLSDEKQGSFTTATLNVFVLAPDDKLKASVNFLELLLAVAFRAANALKTRLQLF